MLPVKTKSYHVNSEKIFDGYPEIDEVIYETKMHEITTSTREDYMGALFIVIKNKD